MSLLSALRSSRPSPSAVAAATPSAVAAATPSAVAAATPSGRPTVEPGAPGTRTIPVAGMSCAHCVAAVTGAVQPLPGVEAVAVDLEGGRVHVRGANSDEAAIRAAIADAGYEPQGR